MRDIAQGEGGEQGGGVMIELRAKIGGLGGGGQQPPIGGVMIELGAKKSRK